MSQKYFHFTLGPVQGFVSQARRTRDFWAGSFLLSWLTAKAMQAVQTNGGTVVMPSVKGNALLERIANHSGPGSNVGSLPNNFIAKVANDFDGSIATKAVQQAWKALADAVWIFDEFERIGVNKTLWDSQIEKFWDMAWVIADTDDGKVLAQRKNWRSYMPPESVGDKCTMMGEWQELSGADKPNPAQQSVFWKKFKHYDSMDLRKGERLCAIAYVKRRFVHCWQELDGHKDWKLPTSVPSTSYMAAVHWLEKLIKTNPDSGMVQDFCRLVSPGERLTRIQAISNALGNNPAVHLKNLADIDGRALFDSDKPEDKDLVAAKKAMLKTIPDFHAPLSPFYAILMMDGDSLGKTKKALADQGEIPTALSEALAVFTSTVPDVVKAHDGFLIYAGGDDVLAVLPLEDALPCAAACRVAYQQAFNGQTATISAAIEYAHMKLPLTMILKDAHQLLDDVAKDQTGRDAVACRVWKPGGQQQTWAMPWDEALESGEVCMMQLAKKLGEDESGEPGYANKLLYHIRETLEMLDGGSDIETQAIEDMLVADYVSSGLLDGKPNKAEWAKELIEPLLKQCRIFEHKKDTEGYKADGALLLRFLAQKGVER